MPDGSEKTRITRSGSGTCARAATQAAVAQKIEVPIETVRNWNKAIIRPARAARALLKLIDKAPGSSVRGIGWMGRGADTKLRRQIASEQTGNAFLALSKGARSSSTGTLLNSRPEAAFPSAVRYSRSMRAADGRRCFLPTTPTKYPRRCDRRATTKPALFRNCTDCAAHGCEQAHAQLVTEKM